MIEKIYIFTDVALIEKVSPSPRISFPTTNTISLLSGIFPEKVTGRISEFFLTAEQDAQPIESERMNLCSFGYDAETIPFMLTIFPT